MDIRLPKTPTATRLTATQSAQALEFKTGQQLDAKIVSVDTDRQTLVLDISHPPSKLEVTSNLPVELKPGQTVALVVTKPSPEAEFKLVNQTSTVIKEGVTKANQVDLEQLILKQLVAEEKIPPQRQTQTPVQATKAILTDYNPTPITTLVTAKVLSSTSKTIRLKLDTMPLLTASTDSAKPLEKILQQVNPELTFIKQTIKEIDSQIKLVLMLPQQRASNPIQAVLESTQNSLLHAVNSNPVKLQTELKNTIIPETPLIKSAQTKIDHQPKQTTLQTQQPLSNPVRSVLESTQNSLLHAVNSKPVEPPTELKNIIAQVAILRTASAKQITNALNFTPLSQQNKIKIETALTFSKMPAEAVLLPNPSTAINSDTRPISSVSLQTADSSKRIQNSANRTSQPADKLPAERITFKPGQTIQLDITQRNHTVEFKIINPFDLPLQPKQQISAKILQIIGDKIQLLVATQASSSPKQTQPAETVMSLSVRQLYSKDLKGGEHQPLSTNELKNLLPTQNLKLEVINTRVPAEFRLIETRPVELTRGQVMTANITEVKGTHLKLALQMPVANLSSLKNLPLPTSVIHHLPVSLNTQQPVTTTPLMTQNKVNQETGHQTVKMPPLTPQVAIQTLQPMLAKFQAGQQIKLEVLQVTPQLQFGLVENMSINEKKIAEITKQLLPIQQPPVEMLNYIVKTLPLLQKNEKIPDALKRLAKEILDSLSPLKGSITPKQLEKSINQSGTWLEAKLAQVTEKNQSDIQNDFKAHLFKFQQALKQPIEAKPASKIPTPELNLIKEMLQKTEHSLARIILNQLATLPKDDAPRQSWSFDLAFIHKEFAEPVKVEIEREKQSYQPPSEENWSVNITISPPGLGTIHCKLSCIDKTVNTRFWSDNRQAVNKIHHHLNTLKSQFEQAGIKPGQLSVSEGKPAKKSTSSDPLSTNQFDQEA